MPTAHSNNTPLPSFSWASGAEVWNCMLEKDAQYAKLRHHKALERHPSLVESYRTILFDWISEVSYECKFHRETYHLALDLIDRYLAATSNVGKLQLQLIGTTCLHLAAKFEEYRPPTVNEFADLTDGACSPEDIVGHEIEILTAINWDMTPVTPNTWLNVYMQILINLDSNDNEANNDCSNETRDQQQVSKQLSKHRTTPVKRQARKINQATPSGMDICDENSLSQPEFKLPTTKNDSFIMPAQNGILKYNHKRIASVIDLALLHIESLRFTNSILTASALYHFTKDETVHQCTGYRYQDLVDCIEWLEPFVETIKEIPEPIFVASCRSQESNSIQMHTHIANASLLETVQTKIELRRLRSTLKRKFVDDDGVADDYRSGKSVSAAASSNGDDNGPNNSHGTSLLDLTSPLKQSTTVLLTPPSSTRKSRRLR